jgi:hypothetical protein
MNDMEEPRRLLESDEAPAGLRALLQRAHDDTPPIATVDLLVRAAEQRACAPSAIRMSRRWSGRGSRQATKFLVAAVIVGVGAGTWYWSGGRTSNSAAIPPLPSDASASARLQVPAQTAPAEATIPLAPDTVATSPNDHARNAKAGRHGRLLAVRAANETETAASIETTTVPSGEEYRLLRSARQALIENPALALHLTDVHARRFERGMLVQEREAIAVEALVRLGREGQARVRAHGFLAAYPSSPYRGRVEAALAQPSAVKGP